MESVEPPDAATREAAVARFARLRVPGRGFGRLEEPVAWWAAAQGRCPPTVPSRPRAVLFAADHGIAAAGVSAEDPEETARRVTRVGRGEAAVGAVAAEAGVGLRVVDVGLAGPDAGLSPADTRRVRDGSGALDHEDALRAEETEAAMTAGAEVADEEVDAGADLLVAGELGVGVSTPTAVLAAAMTGREPVAVVGRGSGIDDPTWMRKTAAVRDGLRRCRAAGRSPRALLATAGGADLAALTGFLARAARRRTPVLLDGAPVAVAALLADAECPGAAAWWLAATRDAEPAQALALDVLGLDPVLTLDLRVGQGTGALALVPLLRTAIRALGESALR